MSRRFRIILSLACCVLAVLVCLVYADGVRAEADRVRSEALARYGGEVVSLVVAREGLEPGDVASSSNVELREWLVDLAPEGALLDLDECLGREVSVAASKGAPLTDVNFRDVTQVADVPAGHVAVTIPVTDKLGVPRSVAIGSALLAYRVGSDSVDLIASDMTVLASPGAATSYAASLQLTVAVLPDDVPDVLAASASNDLRLVMPAREASPVRSGADGSGQEDREESSRTSLPDAGADSSVGDASSIERVDGIEGDAEVVDGDASSRTATEG